MGDSVSGSIVSWRKGEDWGLKVRELCWWEYKGWQTLTARPGQQEEDEASRSSNDRKAVFEWAGQETVDDNGGPPFTKILYRELFSSVVINEFAKSSPHSASWSKSRTNLNVDAALPPKCLGLCLIRHRVLVVNSDWIELEQSGITENALMHLGFVNVFHWINQPEYADDNK